VPAGYSRTFGRFRFRHWNAPYVLNRRFPTDFYTKKSPREGGGRLFEIRKYGLGLFR
jgi:hypothetical protein